MTLAEVLIAMTIFVMLSAGIFAAFTSAAHRNKAAIARTTAYNLASGVCAQIRGIGVAKLATLETMASPTLTPTYFNKTTGQWEGMRWCDNQGLSGIRTTPIPISVINRSGDIAPTSPPVVYVPVDIDVVRRDRTYKAANNTDLVYSNTTTFDPTGTTGAKVDIRLIFVNGAEVEVPATAGLAATKLPGLTPQKDALTYIRVDVTVSAPFGIGGVIPAPVTVSSVISPSFDGGRGVNNG